MSQWDYFDCWHSWIISEGFGNKSHWNKLCWLAHCSYPWNNMKKWRSYVDRCVYRHYTNNYEHQLVNRQKTYRRDYFIPQRFHPLVAIENVHSISLRWSYIGIQFPPIWIPLIKYWLMWSKQCFIRILPNFPTKLSCEQNPLSPSVIEISGPQSAERVH